jgi:hypothetical protein
MDLTMLHQICREGHFAAKVKEDPSLAKLAAVLFASEGPPDILLGSEHEMSDEAIWKFRLQGSSIPAGDQQAIVTYLSGLCHDPHYIPSSFYNYQDGISSSPLIPQANMLHTFAHMTHTYSTFAYHQGNSAIHYSQQGTGHGYGFIQRIWQVPIHCKLL